MKDLIQRLRGYVEEDRFGYMLPSTLLTEAADALERLTAGDVALPQHAPQLRFMSAFTSAQLIDYGNRKDAAGYLRGVLAERERVRENIQNYIDGTP
jgi:hypothetical protein